jgi:hypothetical protein
MRLSKKRPSKPSSEIKKWSYEKMNLKKRKAIMSQPYAVNFQLKKQKNLNYKYKP